MVIYPNFSIKITALLKDGSSEELLVPNDETYKLVDLSLTYEVNEFPKATISLETYNTRKSIQFVDFNVRLHLTNPSCNLSFNMGVSKVSSVGSKFTYEGPMTNSVNFKKITSRYLGSDIKTAINGLLGTHKLVGDIKIPGKYYSINESNLSALMKFSLGIGMDSITCIDNNSIKSISKNTFTTITNKDAEVIPVNDLIYKDDYSESNLIEGEGSNNLTNIKFGLDSISANKENHTYYLNLMSSINLLSGLTTRFNYTTDSFYHESIGDVVSMMFSGSNLPILTPAVIIKKVIRISGIISTDITLATNQLR